MIIFNHSVNIVICDRFYVFYEARAYKQAKRFSSTHWRGFPWSARARVSTASIVTSRDIRTLDETQIFVFCLLYKATVSVEVDLFSNNVAQQDSLD